MVAVPSILLAAALAAASSGANTPAERARALLSDPASSRTLSIAHRACWREAPENSIAAVRACERIGIDGIELDIRHSSDGVAVVIHDDTVDRTTNGTGKVSEMTWVQLARLRLKDGAGGRNAALTRERIPTLNEFLKATKDRFLLVFDVKDWSQGTSFEAAVRLGMERQAIFFYECNNDRLLNNVRWFRDRVILYPIMFERDGPLAPAMARCPSNPVGLAHVKYQNRAWIDAAPSEVRAGKKLWLATMSPRDNAGDDDARALTDPNGVWGAQIDAGAHMIMTDQAEALARYLKSRLQK